MTEQELNADAAAHGEPTDEDAAELGLATMSELDDYMAGVRANATPISVFSAAERLLQ